MARKQQRTHAPHTPSRAEMADWIENHHGTVYLPPSNDYPDGSQISTLVQLERIQPLNYQTADTPDDNGGEPKALVTPSSDSRGRMAGGDWYSSDASSSSGFGPQQPPADNTDDDEDADDGAAGGADEEVPPAKSATRKK